MSGFKRLPNNYGSVSKLSGKRRKPFCAKKLVGSELTDDGKVLYKYRVVGTYETRREALAALAEANLNKDIYERRKFGEVLEAALDAKENRLDPKTMYAYRLAARRFEELAEIPITEIKVADLERCIGKPEYGYTARRQMKMAARAAYQYAIRHDLCDKDVSEHIDVDAKVDVKIVRKPFTKAEIDSLDLTQVADRFVMIGCYTGMRLSEIAGLTVDNIDLEKMFFHNFGVKTEAGKKRIVPIHEKLQPLITQMVSESAEKGVSWLFADGNEQIHRRSLDRRFKARFPNHTTHDCRHTFATNAYACRMNAVIVKLILGHTVNDITLGTYTHILPEDLRQEMEKYHIA